MPPDIPRLEALLEQRGWVQDLARRLVHDPSTAEDVAQEAMLAAIRSDRAGGGAAAGPRSLRGWLAQVVRNQLAERMRRDDRRSTREGRAARPETTPSTLDLVSEVAAHQEVVEALMALPEAYRDVLLRRYYEGETPTEIAEAQGAPVATVKTRLQRGLARLRERLDEKHGGDGRAWLAALAPLTGPVGGGFAPTRGPEPMSALPAARAAWIGVAVAVTVALPALLWLSGVLRDDERRAIEAPGLDLVAAPAAG